MELAKQNPVVRFSWADVDSMVKRIALRIIEDRYSPDLIVGIQRGGLIPAVHLSHLLNVRLVRPLLIQTTNSNKVRSQRISPIVDYVQDLGVIREKNVLIVDDVSNTGNTVLLAQKIVRDKSPLSIKTSVLVLDSVPSEKGLPQIEKLFIDYFDTEINAWAQFPWES